MHHLDLILTLTGGLAAALVLGYITQRLGLSPIIGYLLAGVAVGPNTPGYIANPELANQMAEVGVILLMFGVGLHFHLKDLLAVRRVAVPGAMVQICVATLLGCAVTMAFGWTWQAGIVFGLAISVASTVVLLRVLADNNDLHTPAGHIAVGWLIVEDLFTVLVLVLLPVIFPAPGPVGAPAADGGQIPTPEAAQHSVPLALGWATLKIGVLVAFVFVVGGRVIPWLLERVAALAVARVVVAAQHRVPAVDRAAALVIQLIAPRRHEHEPVFGLLDVHLDAVVVEHPDRLVVFPRLARRVDLDRDVAAARDTAGAQVGALGARHQASLDRFLRAVRS